MSLRASRSPARSALLVIATLACLVALEPFAFAQIVHHPFAVGASEGAVGHQNAFGAWILAEESRFYLSLTHAVRDTKDSPRAVLGLIALSFGYGIFHAAGPGHGKAVITSYMVSNEVALRRGLLIALLAAIVQGLVATALVGIAAFVFNATAPTMTAASQAIELASYLGIVLLGLILIWRKGRAVLVAARALRPIPGFAFVQPALASTGGLGSGGWGSGGLGSGGLGSGRLGIRESVRFSSDDGTAHGADCDCGHSHMPDPTRFGADAFDWKAAAIAVVTAGARPCSGAILVLVFAFAQGIFLAGIAATFAMSIGTAITTGALAITAVFAKDLAMRASGGSSPRALLVGRCVELGAAACVLLFGIALLGAALTGVHGSG